MDFKDKAMTDLACWPIETGMVIRIRGSEHLLTTEEFVELLSFMQAGEGFSEGYSAIEVPPPFMADFDVIAALNLKPKLNITRRKL